MGYYIDLEQISIDEYQRYIEKSDLLPSRRIIKENLSERFTYFKNIGITNVLELQRTLKKNDKLTELAKINCFSTDYLKILLREINSIQPKPTKISEFKGISQETIKTLEKHGFQNTFKLFDKIKTKNNRNELAKITGISAEEILELTKLTDLSRIRWVGATFARMLYDIGVDTAEKAANSNFTDLHLKINQTNKEKKYFNGNIGLNDMKLLVNAAKEIPLEVEY